ncbi:hypothetical protein [Alicyclobacillus tolerans]|uniref:Uncharacterized protein n=2 Tax=Alicyclobacillus tolerans TaxID=90970 RepID=A0ABT9LXQ5_9BACL|nr:MULTISPECIES: hypothetical protein [Alicyclobacillus]MDP9729048.1 hypothetical protein [Alicyclobacillus tengchongensis]SHK89482.1 hypothetical protein SAMN05443507_12610 [Alicyclobacillus montanus]
MNELTSKQNNLQLDWNDLDKINLLNVLSSLPESVVPTIRDALASIHGFAYILIKDCEPYEFHLTQIVKISLHLNDFLESIIVWNNQLQHSNDVDISSSIQNLLLVINQIQNCLNQIHTHIILIPDEIRAQFSLAFLVMLTENYRCKTILEHLAELSNELKFPSTPSR